MSHNIKYFEYKEDVDRRKVQAELDNYVAHEDWQEGCSGLSSPIRWIESCGVLGSYEDALPPWKWVMKRLCACYERDATLASLFDGIGGFPLIWEQINGKGSCLWASEIEEFPIAVTKKRIGG